MSPLQKRGVAPGKDKGKAYLDVEIGEIHDGGDVEVWITRGDGEPTMFRGGEGTVMRVMLPTAGTASVVSRGVALGVVHEAVVVYDDGSVSRPVGDRGPEGERRMQAWVNGYNAAVVAERRRRA